MNPERREQYLKLFLSESADLLDVLEAGLLSLEQGKSSVRTVPEMLRAVHTLKGNSATFGFFDLVAISHRVEGLLEKARRDDLAPDALSHLLAVVDLIRAILRKRGPATEPHATDVVEITEEQVQVALRKLDALQSSSPGDKGGVGGAAVPSSARSLPAGWRIVFAPHARMLLSANDPVLLFRALEALGPLTIEADVSALPDLTDFDAELCYLRWTLYLRCDVPRDLVMDVFEWVEGDCNLEVTPIDDAAPATTAAPHRAATAPVSASFASSTLSPLDGTDAAFIRVDVEKIETLINMVGELFITQSMLSRYGLENTAALPSGFQDDLALLERNTRELQESVLRIRMVPMDFVFQRMTRVVRDLANQLGKQVSLALSGGGTEIDKSVLERIVDPLVHLMRNAVDHGIEPTAARRRAGKPETGLISLSAQHRSGAVVVELADDGAGISRAALRARARQLNLLDDVPDDRLLDLIFVSGFSTRKEVDVHSGRGVGLDAVRRNVAALGGTVNVWSEEGKGTRFELRLPLTLAIVDGQLVRAGGQIYLFPLLSIVECVQASAARLHAVANARPVLMFREECVAVYRLEEVLECVSPDAAERFDEFTVAAGDLLAVVEAGGLRVAFRVDELLEQQQVVVKNIERNFRRVSGILGATVLGDGSVALILDVAGLCEQLGGSRVDSAGARQEVHA